MIEVDGTDYAACRAFVTEVVRVGLMLVNMFDVMLEETPEEAFPGEDLGEVWLEMMTGTALPAAAAVGRDGVVQATALVGALADRVVADLQAALEIVREREGGAG